MRIFVFILMIVLLPLRGWAGEVMATEMAASQVIHIQKQTEVAIKSVTAHAHHHSAITSFDRQKPGFEVQKPLSGLSHSNSSATHDCEGHEHAADAGAAMSHCDTCAACQDCNTAALSLASDNLSPTFLASTQPQTVATHFASAVAALGQKPPIS
jgi:hypothetical protein